MSDQEYESQQHEDARLEHQRLELIAAFARQAYFYLGPIGDWDGFTQWHREHGVFVRLVSEKLYVKIWHAGAHYGGHTPYSLDAIVHDSTATLSLFPQRTKLVDLAAMAAGAIDTFCKGVYNHDAFALAVRRVCDPVNPSNGHPHETDKNIVDELCRTVESVQNLCDPTRNNNSERT